MESTTVGGDATEQGGVVLSGHEDGSLTPGHRVRQPLNMSIIAQELDERLRTLDPRRAARCEQLVRDVLALLADEPKPAPQPRGEFITRTHDSGLMPGIDPTKLGQMAEEL